MVPDQINLLLLPYAGGGAGIFRGWEARLPARIHPVPIVLPGRGTRHGEELLHTWPALIDVLSRDMQRYLERPVAIFGHSLGALIALELAHVMRRSFGQEPVWLGVSACIAPSRRHREFKWLHCPEDEFIQELRSLNGTPRELLDNRELLDLLLPILRADFHLAGVYEDQDRLPLTMPMLILGGAQDKESSACAENLAAWRDETTGPARIEMIDAGHFFVDTHREAVIQAVRAGLAEVRPIEERADV